MRSLLVLLSLVAALAFAVNAGRWGVAAAFGAALVIAAVVASLPRWFARRRLRAIIASGDVRSLLRAWFRSAATLANPEVAIPLMVATAYASFGWVEEARRARAAITGGAGGAGPSREQLEFVDVLLEVYEGDREAAVRRAEALVDRTVPEGDGAFAGRVRSLRRGLLAIARAFAHRATDEDARALVAMREPVPILTWPLRYAEAVVALDAGDRSRAEAVLRAAPAWPENSVFRAFHAELEALVGARWRADRKSSRAPEG
jgi:hypothetical protein